MFHKNTPRRSAKYVEWTKVRLRSVRTTIENLRDSWRIQRANFYQSEQFDKVLHSIHLLRSLYNGMYKLKIILDNRTRRLENIETGLVSIAIGLKAMIHDLRVIERGINLKCIDFAFSKGTDILHTRPSLQTINYEILPQEPIAVVNPKDINEDTRDLKRKEIELMQNVHEIDRLLDQILFIYEGIEIRLGDTFAMTIKSLELLEKNEKLAKKLDEASLGYRKSMTALGRFFARRNFNLPALMTKQLIRDRVHFDT